ncbi:hypothetical protein LBMAG27_22870 [Bacteroidota bacterium]|nr:hypothetical protein LBMAG27_22870 [Bacteroidota bacterium]
MKKSFIAFFVKTLFILSVVIFFSECKKKEPIETCSDGIKNQNETNIDCGGTCDACPLPSPSLSAKIDGNSWAPSGIPSMPGHAIYSSTNGGALVISGSDYTGTGIAIFTLSISDTCSIQLGNFGLGKSTGLFYFLSGPPLYCMIDSGEINISKVDTLHNIIDGSFYFDCNDTSGTHFHHVTDGVFKNISY